MSFLLQFNENDECGIISGEVIKMQYIFDAGCSPALYQLQGKSFDFPDMTNVLCPHCKNDYLRRHGFYWRYLITVNFEGELMIRRYSCPDCGKTVSLLPSFCHPMRTYSIQSIIGLLREFYVNMKTVCAAVANFLMVTGVGCSRQLLRHYRLRIEQNLNSLVMAITDIRCLKEPLVTETMDIKRKVRQMLLALQSPPDDSLKIFKRTRTTYLTPQPV